MITIEEMQNMLDEIAAEFPPEFFDELNGGIVLLSEARHHEDDPDGELYTLGQYYRGGGLGRYISIYYGSFMCVYGYLSPDKFKEKLRATVRHEFRHHFESLAGDDDLERIDEKYIDDYLNGVDDGEDDGYDEDEDDGDYLDEDSFCDDDFIEELDGGDEAPGEQDGGTDNSKRKRGWWRGK
jgi:predicted Zn-dependent protease with MMP-like domain